MSNDRIDEGVKAKVDSWEYGYTVGREQAADLWTRLQAKESVRVRRRWSVIWLRVAAVVVVLVGILFLLRPHKKDVMVVSKPEMSAPQYPAAVTRTPDTVKRVAVVAQGDLHEIGVRRFKRPAEAKPVYSASIAKAVKELKNVEDPRNIARQEIEMIAVRGGEMNIKDHIEF